MTSSANSTHNDVTPQPTTESGISLIVHNVPVEIWDTILLEHVPASDLQRTCLSLLSVFPHAPVSVTHLWRHVVIRKGSQLALLWRKVREIDQGRPSIKAGPVHAKGEDDDGATGEWGGGWEDDEEREWIGGKVVRSFEMRSWKGDADILNNCVNLMTRLHTLRLNIGTNWSPEHLEDAFLKPRPDLTHVLIRFKPYVEKASYYQFLKGQYFDSCLDALSSWPTRLSRTLSSDASTDPPSFQLRFLSLVQEVPPLHLVDSKTPTPIRSQAGSDDEDEDVARDSKAKKRDIERVIGRGNYTGSGPFSYLPERLESLKPKLFAQPIVFFNTNCLTTLSLSPLNRSLTHLRLRIPQRDIITPLSLPPHLISPHPLTQQPFPSLRFLDLSTSNIRLNTHLPSLLRTYPFLEHLVMDHTNLFGFLGKEREKGRELCMELGRLVGGLSGIQKGREAERAIGKWEDEQAKRRERERRWREEGNPEEENGEGEEGGGRGDEVDEAADRLAALTTEEYNVQTGRARRRQARPMNQSTFRLNQSSASTAGSSSRQASFSAAAQSSLPPPPPSTISFVLPPIPSLRSLSLGGETPRPLPPSERREWVNEFQAGWKEGTERLVKWAVDGVGQRFERARRKAEQERWEWEKRGGVGISGGGGGDATAGLSKGSANGKSVSSSSSPANNKGKGKASASSRARAFSSASSSTHPSLSPTHSTTAVPSYPPPKVLLLRFPTAADSPPSHSDLSDLSSLHSSPAELLNLIPVDPESDWRSSYTDLLLFPSASSGSSDQPRIVFCPVADDPRGGPLRRGEETKLGAGSGYGTPRGASAGASGSGTPRSTTTGAGGGEDGEENGARNGGLGGKRAEETLAEIERGGHQVGCGHLVGRAVWGD